jgi:hypothetical protein
MGNDFSVWDNWLAKQVKSKVLSNAEIRQIIYSFSDILLNADARLAKRMSYGAPFIYRYGPIGYFGVDNLGVYFGFYWGKLLLDKPGAEILEVDERKMVKVVRLPSTNVDEFVIGNLLGLLQSALEIDRIKYSKNPKP